MKPTFHVQTRLLCRDKVLQDWQDTHVVFNSFDEAACFHERMLSSFREESKVEDEVDELERLVIKMMKRSGGDVSFRIVKRTYTEEVLEHA